MTGPASHQASSLSGGFAAPVFAAQAVFRATMDAMARPGKLVDFAAEAAPPPPLPAEAGALALTLLDHETPVWLDQKLARSATVADWLRFHTGAPIVTDPKEADFALVCDPAHMPVLSAFRLGTAEFPDRSTTLIVAVEGLDGPDCLTLTGPGIREIATLAPHPLPIGFADQAAANRDLYPRGVDIVFTAFGRLAALPRSIRIEKNGA
jgi:alpha-D-ribose 1-methylphosphonate 5-triphosphate synthase subunit PhnH